MLAVRIFLIVATFLSPCFSDASEVVRNEKQAVSKKNKPVIAQRGRRGNRGGWGRGRGRGGVRFRFYVGPRYGYYRRGYYRDYGYYYNQVSINIRESREDEERVLDAYIDGYRINLRPPSPNGNRGSYSYRLNPGYHEVEWTVESSRGKTQSYSHNFYIDRYNRYTNILIDGDQIYIN